ncbi:MAG: aconitate hydratase AcnA [Spirochaetaceae bacterium]|nr:MAG: aconitate hydratase AcnA [Spirochaetaceae bacterium]
MSNGSVNDSFGVTKRMSSAVGELTYYDLHEYAAKYNPDIEKWPVSMRVLFESVLRNENGIEVTEDHVRELTQYNPKAPQIIEVPFKPARVLLQDFTGVPCVVDLAAMRSAMARLGGDPSRINPELAVDLVIDHSVQVDFFNSSDALKKNSDLEFQRNRERYEFLRWGQGAFRNFSVVPPASGICHQVNLEYLGRAVQVQDRDGVQVAFPDTLVGTDSHTPMINGLGILGWGVGGIEAEAAMLGQPIFMLAPSVVGVKLEGKMNTGITATDLVLRITEMLRKHGVVGKFVEFFGPGLSNMTVPDRATISNMAPEYGATCGFFPVDQQALDYMYATGRPTDLIEMVETYTRAQGMFRTDDSEDPEYEAVLHLDLSTVEPSIAGPKRPQDRISLPYVSENFRRSLTAPVGPQGYGLEKSELDRSGETTLDNGETVTLRHGDVAIAAITSCTNTSNPSVLLGAGLLAKKAVEAGLKPKPWIKTSFAPGSMVVTEYLQRTGLMEYLEKVGFYLVGYGCTTCIGNSGPLPEPVSRAVEDNDLIVAGVLSGNRNFEGRINPHTKANYLMSPPLVVAYALAGNVGIDLTREPLGTGADGNPVYLKDVWPSNEELEDFVKRALDRDAFIASYSGLEDSNPEWNKIELSGEQVYQWDEASTYIQEPPFFQNMSPDPDQIRTIDNARVLVKVGDSITTDHISPAGAIDPASPAGRYLIDSGVEKREFNSYGSRRGNDRVMTRGTFANIRLRNQLAPGTEGSWTTHYPGGEVVDIHEASRLYEAEQVPTIVLAGEDYGMGSSRDWAAKGAYLLGIRAVIAMSFERIHRSNLVGMGVVPLQFKKGESADTLGLDGSETFAIKLSDDVTPKQDVQVVAKKLDGTTVEFTTMLRIDSPVELEYVRNGGILQTVLRRFLLESKKN